MLGLLTKMMGVSHDTDCSCDLFSTDPSTDEEKMEPQLPVINIQGAVSRKNSQALNLEDQESNTEKDTSGSPASSAFDSTDSNRSPREARRKTSKTVSREVLQRVSELVEYYLSDENLVQDMFLLKHVTKHKEGFVSLKLLANYKKLKRVRKDWTVLVDALKNSPNLEINQEGTKVRRRNKLSCELEEDTRLFRSLLAFEIPDELAHIETMAETFGKFGDVDCIQMHKPGGKSMPEMVAAEREMPGISAHFCCLVVFDKVHGARMALKHFSNEKSLKVMVVPRPKTAKLDWPREYESAYFSASDLDDGSGSPYLFCPSCDPKPLPRSLTQDWPPGRCFSPCSSSPSSPRAPKFHHCSHFPSFPPEDRPQPPLVTATHNLRQLRLRSSPHTPSPLAPRKFFGCSTPNNSPRGHKRALFRPFQQAVSAPNSPWMNRKPFVRSDSNENCHSPREASLPDNVIRLPRGPTGEKGFRHHSETDG